MLPLALRHLLSRKRQTLLTFLGVLFASTAYVVITGFFLGFQIFLLEQLINNDAHVHVKPRQEYLTAKTLDKDLFEDKNNFIFWDKLPLRQISQNYINKPQDWYELLKNSPQVTAFSPMLSKQMLLTQGSQTVSVNLLGVEALKQTQVSNIGEKMQVGSFSDLNFGGNRLIVGEGLMKKLGSQVSNTVLVSDNKGITTPFKIVGVFKTGLKPVDDGRAFGSLADIQQVSGAKSQINDIAIKVKNYKNAKNLANSWEAISSDKVESWDEINESFLAVFKAVS